MELRVVLSLLLCLRIVSIKGETNLFVDKEQSCRKGYIKEFVSNLENAFDECKSTEKECATKADLVELKDEIASMIAEQNEKLMKYTKDWCSSKPPIITTGSYPTDCEDIEKSNQGELSNGKYTIYPHGNTSGVDVRCETGGWTVIQRRVSDSDFYKTWQEYEDGFGDLDENFWLGNKYIHWITTQATYSLRIDLTSMDNETAYAEYREFAIGDASSGYKLNINGYSGTAGDSLTTSGNGNKFTTKDRDNDIYSRNCAVMYHGGWWYDKCHTSNLNGDYGNTNYAKGPVWKPWKGFYAPMKTTVMKIRRVAK